MIYCTDKHLDRILVVLVREQGWRIEGGGERHLKCYPPDRTKSIVVVSASPSDQRSSRAVICQLRRSGAVIRGRGRAEVA